MLALYRLLRRVAAEGQTCRLQRDRSHQSWSLHYWLRFGERQMLTLKESQPERVEPKSPSLRRLCLHASELYHSHRNYSLPHLYPHRLWLSPRWMLTSCHARRFAWVGSAVAQWPRRRHWCRSPRLIHPCRSDEKCWHPSPRRSLVSCHVRQVAWLGLVVKV
jgi:hypothetical protein